MSTVRIKKYALFVSALLIKVVNTICDIQSNSANDFTHNGFSITEYISQHGYDVEAHVNIETEDGYLLDMFRIPHGKNQTESTKPPVLMMHGVLGSAENWVINGPDRALAFVMADRGHDVWLGNARGSTHSRKHTTLNPDVDTSYWQFSWHEIGYYDLPAKIDYIVQETNHTEIFYVGHSQGTTSFFVMGSERPSYNAHIKLMVALAPAAYLHHIPHPGLQIASRFISSISMITNLLGINEFIPNNELIQLAGQTVCQNRAIIRELCANILFVSCGYDSDQLDRDLLPLIAQTTPAGASTKQLYHYGQEINSGEFRRYDYGTVGNLAKYNSPTPPRYDLGKLVAPVALYNAKNDWLVSQQDVDRLADELGNVVVKHLVEYENFNHLDFIFAKDCVQLLYNKVFEAVDQYI